MGKSVIVGTAGHIDHGKSSLIKALTGIDPDRLIEEKKRGITIDLGYAGLNVGENLISFIDVPGHESFVKNMIAGATSFDIGLVVVDAVEGIKAQTIEHSNIIKSIGVKQVIVAITKSDLLDDKSLKSAIEKVKNFYKTYNFDIIDFIPVSIFEQKSIESLKQLLSKHVDKFESDNYTKPFYLRIDRVFSKKGFGVIVTGSCLFGKINIGDEIEILPHKKDVKIRAVNIHGKEVESGEAHQRLALNLVGIKGSELRRGNVLIKKGKYKPFKTFFCEINIFSNIDKTFTIKTNKTYHLFIGSEHLDAKIIILNKKEIKNGENAFCKIVFSSEYPAYTGEVFLIRGLEPTTTVASGKIITADIGLKNKIMSEALSKNSAKESIKFIFENINKGLDLQTNTQYFDFEIESYFKELNIMSFGNLKISASLISKWLKTIKNELSTNDRLDISKIIPVEYLENQKFFSLIKKLIETKIIDNRYKFVSMLIEKNKESKLDMLSQKVLALMEEDITISNKTLISQKMSITIAEAETSIKILSNKDLIKKIDDNVYVAKKNLDNFINKAKEIALNEGFVDVKNIRKKFEAPRKILIPLLDYLDRLPDFVKKEQKRYLKKKN